MIKIYGGSNCPNCGMAKKLLDSKGVAYRYYDIREDEVAFENCARKLGRTPTSIPIIFDDVELIGNTNDLFDLFDLFLKGKE